MCVPCRILRKLLDHQPGQEQNEVRINRNGNREQHHDNKRRQRIFRDSEQTIANQAIDDEQVKADWRRNLGNFNHDHQVDAEPDRIEPGCLDQWQRDRQTHDDHRKPIEQATEDNIHD